MKSVYEERWNRIHAALVKRDTKTLQRERIDSMKRCGSVVALLEDLLKESGVTWAYLIVKAVVGKSLLYKIFEGEKKLADRNLAIRLVMAMRFGAEECNRLLSAAGLKVLDCDDMRDLILTKCLEQHETLVRTDEWLQMSGLEGLF